MPGLSWTTLSGGCRTLLPPPPAQPGQSRTLLPSCSARPRAACTRGRGHAPRPPGVLAVWYPPALPAGAQPAPRLQPLARRRPQPLAHPPPRPHTAGSWCVLQAGCVQQALWHRVRGPEGPQPPPQDVSALDAEVLLRRQQVRRTHEDTFTYLRFTFSLATLGRLPQPGVPQQGGHSLPCRTRQPDILSWRARRFVFAASPFFMRARCQLQRAICTPLSITCP